MRQEYDMDMPFWDIGTLIAAMGTKKAAALAEVAYAAGTGRLRMTGYRKRPGHLLEGRVRREIPPLEFADKVIRRQSEGRYDLSGPSRDHWRDLKVRDEDAQAFLRERAVLVDPVSFEAILLPEEPAPRHEPVLPEPKPDVDPPAAWPTELSENLQEAAWQLAEYLLNRRRDDPDSDGPVAPPPGRGRKANLARMVRKELRRRGRSVEDETVRKYISPDVDEWESENPGL
jgi:hypothetical protein